MQSEPKAPRIMTRDELRANDPAFREGFQVYLSPEHAHRAEIAQNAKASKIPDWLHDWMEIDTSHD